MTEPTVFNHACFTAGHNFFNKQEKLTEKHLVKQIGFDKRRNWSVEGSYLGMFFNAATEQN